MEGRKIEYYNDAVFFNKSEDTSYPDPFINETYEVIGFVMDKELNLIHSIDADFASLEGSIKHFNKVKKKYPTANIKLYKASYQLLQHYR